jgi:L-threonylcarbamoyladenylate synthase
MPPILPFTFTHLPRALEILKQGGVIIVPTDTVYGLICHPAYPEALERIRQMKGRDRDKPFQLLAASTEAVWQANVEKTPIIERFARFWPGALTLVLEAKHGVTEGFRVPANDLLRNLLEQGGGYLRATSVNISGTPPATSLNEIPEEIQNAVDLILDGGSIVDAEASSVIRITPGGEIQVLRAGAITIAENLS